ncbi:MAG: potassium transporter, partial [Hellea sp.]|nr:potassium transporter [Hellea sp.]
LMTLVGLSPALGTFLAGVVLANSEYRHELESDIDPFKGLLLGVFFITVGANINFGLLGGNLGHIVGMTFALIAIKASVLLILARIFRIPKPENWLFGLGLAQAGEFGFVLLSFTVANDIIPKSIADQLLLVVTLSMLVTPALFIIYDKIIAPRHSQEIERVADHIDEQNHIIIAGHGRFGGIVNRAVRFAGFDTTVLDYSAEQLDILSAFGVDAYYGDATRPDLLHAAGIKTAKVLVIAIDDKDHITRLTHYVHHNYPHVHIVARAIDRPHVFELWETGCRDIIRETYDSSLRAGRSVLEALGYSRDEANQFIKQVENFDRGSMPEMASLYRSGVPLKDNKDFVQRAREILEEFEANIRNNN